METKIFDLRVLLSVTTGRLLTKMKSSRDNGISDLYALLTWMTDDDELFTHQLLRFMNECRPWLVRWFPELADIKSDDVPSVDSRNSRDAIEEWLAHLVKQPEFKQQYDVPRIPKEKHRRRDAVEELIDMVGEDKVIIVAQKGKP